MKLIFDVETTGFTDNDDILQISVIKLNNDNSFNFAYNTFFKTDKEYGSAYVVHGLLREKLANSKYSQKDIQYVVQVLFEDVDTVIGYNVSFDLGMLYSKCNPTLNSQLRQMKPLDMMRDLDWYKKIYSTKNRHRYDFLRLEESVSEMINRGANLDNLKKEYQKMFKVSEGDFHDARFDVYMTYVLYRDYYLPTVQIN